MQTEQALAYDDVLIKPGYAAFDRADIRLNTNLTETIKLNAPIVSSPMDTVTESNLAIALARAGGLGFIHRNLTIADQVAEVRKVKSARLAVGAAVGASPGFEDRVKALAAAGVDILLVDSAHGHSHKVISALVHIKSHHDIPVVAGSIATAEGAAALIAAGADALRVGMGPAAICTTRVVSGMGMPQLSATLHVSRVARRHGIPVIADGGITYSGDITKALAAGASCVMLGKLFAACTESPAETVRLTAKELPPEFKQSRTADAHTYTFKQHRGMGSVGAMQRGISASSEDEFHGKPYTDDVLIAEGIEGLTPCSGTVEQLMQQLVGGVTSGLYYSGARTIPDLWRIGQFVQTTPASVAESHPHHMHITNSGGNY